jgi:hypothetical protein
VRRWRTVQRRYGASSTTLPLWVRLLLTAPFAYLVAVCVLQFVSVANSVYGAFSLVFVVGSAYAAWVLVPHLWVRSDRAVRDERREQILALHLRHELALGEVREVGADRPDAETGTWQRRPSAPSRW